MVYTYVRVEFPSDPKLDAVVVFVDGSRNTQILHTTRERAGRIQSNWKQGQVSFDSKMDALIAMTKI